MNEIISDFFNKQDNEVVDRLKKQIRQLAEDNNVLVNENNAYRFYNDQQLAAVQQENKLLRSRISQMEKDYRTLTNHALDVKKELKDYKLFIDEFINNYTQIKKMNK